MHIVSGKEKNTMTLCIDIGNSNIVLGGFEGGKLSFVARISTDISKTQDEYACTVLDVLSLKKVDKSLIDGCIISSVVPPLNSIVKNAVKSAFGIDSLTVGPGIKTGLCIHCDNPSSVGSDIICACVAAHHLYRESCLVIDMGTATKMSLIDNSGTFEGVSIIPGVIMGLKALSSGTAQLPQISLEAPGNLVGKNTVDSMKSGIIYGNASLIDGMIDRFIEETGENLKVIATGGLAKTITAFCKHETVLDDNLVLKGLNIIYSKNK